MDIAGIVSAYRRTLGEFEEIRVRRYGAANLFFDYPCHARVTKFEPMQQVGSAKQVRAELIILAEDLVNAQFPAPLRKNDKVLLRGAELNVEEADGNTRRVGAVLLAYEVKALGNPG